MSQMMCINDLTGTDTTDLFLRLYRKELISASAPTPIHPTPTPIHPAPTPIHPTPTPSHPAPTPIHPAPTPIHPTPLKLLIIPQKVHVIHIKTRHCLLHDNLHGLSMLGSAM